VNIKKSLPGNDDAIKNAFKAATSEMVMLSLNRKENVMDGYPSFTY
jgi:hypothetical protein